MQNLRDCHDVTSQKSKWTNVGRKVEVSTPIFATNRKINIFSLSKSPYSSMYIWSQLSLNCLNPSEWGWKMVNGILIPIKTDLDAPSDDLLKVILCKCKFSSKNTCGSKQCSCANNRLRCVSACGDCRGVSCSNVSADREGIDMDIENDVELIID